MKKSYFIEMTIQNLYVAKTTLTVNQTSNRNCPTNNLKKSLKMKKQMESPQSYCQAMAVSVS